MSVILLHDRFGGLPEYVRELKEQGIKFVTILDPCISTGEDENSYRPLQLGNEMDVWLRDPSGEYVLGEVWPADPVYFPDYAKQAGKVNQGNCNVPQVSAESLGANLEIYLSRIGGRLSSLNSTTS